MKYILNGWPISSKNLSAKIKPYYAFRDELVIEDGIIVKQQQVVIPKSLQKEYIIELHQRHPEKDATKARALDTVYWTGINEDIEKMIASCTVCNRHKPRQQKEMHELESSKWGTKCSVFHALFIQCNQPKSCLGI